MPPFTFCSSCKVRQPAELKSFRTVDDTQLDWIETFANGIDLLGPGPSWGEVELAYMPLHLFLNSCAQQRQRNAPFLRHLLISAWLT